MNSSLLLSFIWLLGNEPLLSSSPQDIGPAVLSSKRYIFKSPFYSINGFPIY